MEVISLMYKESEVDWMTSYIGNRWDGLRVVVIYCKGVEILMAAANLLKRVEIFRIVASFSR